MAPWEPWWPGFPWAQGSGQAERPADRPGTPLGKLTLRGCCSHAPVRKWPGTAGICAEEELPHASQPGSVHPRQRLQGTEPVSCTTSLTPHVVGSNLAVKWVSCDIRDGQYVELEETKSCALPFFAAIPCCQYPYVWFCQEPGEGAVKFGCYFIYPNSNHIL